MILSLHSDGIYQANPHIHLTFYQTTVIISSEFGVLVEADNEQVLQSTEITEKEFNNCMILAMRYSINSRTGGIYFSKCVMCIICSYIQIISVRKIHPFHHKYYNKIFCFTYFIVVKYILHNC